MGTRVARERGRERDGRGQGIKEARRKRGRESRKREGKVEILVGGKVIEGGEKEREGL